MRVAVIGAGGQLGQDLLRAFTDHDVTALAHADLDISIEHDVSAAITDLAPDLVINAAAWTDVDGCTRDPDRAHVVNALGALHVARVCALVGATMVQISTDYVFDGTQPEPYTEFDPVSPVSAYGASKAAGDALVREALPTHFIVRTAWVCGATGTNFVRTMLRLGRERSEVRVVDDQRGSPTFTTDLALSIRELSVTGMFGTWNRTNRGSCTWHELAVATFELAGMDVTVIPISSDEFETPTPRPSFSVLSDRHATLSGLTPLPDWRDGLARLVAELEQREGTAS